MKFFQEKNKTFLMTEILRKNLNNMRSLDQAEKNEVLKSVHDWISLAIHKKKNVQFEFNDEKKYISCTAEHATGRFWNLTLTHRN